MPSIAINGQAYSSLTNALAAATAGQVVDLGPGVFDPSPTSLAGVKAAGVTIRGAQTGGSSLFSNSRLFSRGTDGGSPPSGLSLEDLAFRYGTEFGSNNSGYLLSSSTGSVPYNPTNPTSTGLSLNNVTLRGVHRGAQGANGTYFDLSGSKDSSLSHVNVSLSGQTGYQAGNGTGGGYFLFFEGGDNLKILDSEFDESGYSSSLAILFSGNNTVKIGRAHV